MAEKAKVLFISAPVGAGHVRAARAVGAAIRRLAPAVETDFADVFAFFHPLLGRTILAGYLKLLDVFPQAYGAAYSWGNTSRLALAGRQRISACLAGRMRRYIEAARPAAVVVTHATPAGLMAHLTAAGHLALPTVAVVTDFVVHRLWVYPELGDYFVAHEDMRSYLAANGIAATRSRAVGIPVDERFAAPLARPEAAAGLDLRADRPTVLIMGGGAGVMPMPEIIGALDSLGLPFQIIAVAGYNTALRRRLAALAASLRHCRLLPLGFVDNVHQLMAAADFLISKPGGLTAAEALVKGLPLIVYRPIPGQEEANTGFLVARGAAVRVGSAAALRSVAAELTARPEKLAAMREAALALGRPRAAEDIARHILARIGKSGLD